MTSLENYIYNEITSRYANFDAAHREDHVSTVISQALELLDRMPSWLQDHPEARESWDLPVDRNVLLAAAACHDLGLVNGRDNHHLDSGKIIRDDARLREWFDEGQIETIAQAAEDHRASGKSAPRSIFGMLVSASDGSLFRWNAKAKAASVSGLAILFAAPLIISGFIGRQYEYSIYSSEENLDVVIVQPNIDPYNKFEAMTQAQQNGIFLSLAEKALEYRKDDPTAAPLLLLAPETLTSDIILGDWSRSNTWREFTSFLKDYPGVNLLFGASTYDYIYTREAPSYTARNIREGLWLESHNSAMITDGTERTEVFHKSKLVVGVEHTPYPRIFCPIDNKLGGVMGRCVGQDEISLLNVAGGDSVIPVGCAVCYESVYGEYYTDYIRKGARAMTIITNDAWWGNTPGYRQHLSYASLRAIETRRAIARCANTGISAIISPSGKVLNPTPWWEQAVITGTLPLRDDITFFVSHGDITGRVCTFIFLLLFLALAVRFFTRASR